MSPLRLVHAGQLNQGFEQLQAASPVAVLPVDRDSDQAGSDARGSEQRDPTLPRQRLSRAGFSAVAQFVQTDPDRNLSHHGHPSVIRQSLLQVCRIFAMSHATPRP